LPPINVPLHAPELAPGSWIQGPEVSIKFARGTVVLVDFWESTCVNCVRTLPYLKAWHERYAGRGLVIVGVHTPEFEFTADPGLVAAAVRDEGLPYSVLLDQDRATWLQFANHYWPAKYLIDARGYLRYEHFGEGAYGETEEWIQRLLREAGDTAPMPEPLEPVREEDRPGAVCYPATREIHVGYHRGKLLAPEGYRPGEEVRHVVSLPSKDLSLSKTHAQFQVAPDGALVVMDRGSTNGSVLIRKGVTKPLTAGRPATLVDGDTVRFGDACWEIRARA